jgi:Carboxypeptidase regulatory-like domain/TonB dependent receptor
MIWKFASSNAKKPLLMLMATIMFLWASMPLYSQSSQSSIQGSVSDQSGGLIAGASVTVIDVARGTTRALVTNGAGEYVANSVVPSTYTIRAEAQGFSTVERSGVLLQVSQNIRVDLVLQPGVQTQTITVTGEIPAIDTTDAQLGGTVSNTLVDSLPLNGRNFDRLVQLAPGVVQTSVGAGTGTGEYTNGRRAGDNLYRVEGIATIAQTANLSGVLNGAYRAGDTSSLLPIDAIQEFNTAQSPKAQDGWKEGSVISVAIKSGTNTLHGTAYAFGRNAQATDAANYFTGAVTPATLEQFGATAGGPILKNKLFWFAGYEGLRDTLGDTAVDQIPNDVGTGAVLTAATAKTSTNLVDLCNFLKVPGNGGVSPLSAQLAGLSNFATGSAGNCTVTPASATFENLFPFNASPTNVNYNPPLTSQGPLNNGLFKADYIPTSHHQFTGMVFIGKTTQTVNQNTGQLLPQWELNLSDNVYMYEGGWTWSPNSTWVNSFRLGTAYFDNFTLLADRNLLAPNPYPNGYSLPTGVTNPAFGGLPQIQYGLGSNFLGSGTRGPSERGPEGSLDLVDNISYLRGKHAFKFGFEYVDAIFDGNPTDQAEGQIKFKSLQGFLQGAPSGGTITVGNPQTYVRGHWFAGFFQDDWRLTQRVTLNMGLRYEYYASPTERSNYLGNFNPNVNPAITPAIQQVGPGQPLSHLYNSNYDNLSPRLGLAWDVRGNGKTVVRAGASLLTDFPELMNLIQLNPFGANFVSPGTGLVVNNSGTVANAHSPATLTPTAAQMAPNWNTTGPIFPISDATTINGVTYTGLTCVAPTVVVTTGAAGPCPVTIVPQNFRLARAAEWSVDIERAITNSLALDLAYVGNHGFHEMYTADLNQPALFAGWDAKAVGACLGSANDITKGVATPFDKCSPDAAAELGPYSVKFPYLSYINSNQFNGVSNYDSLQIIVTQRVSHGLSFLAGYTYSHALDDNVFPSDANNPKLTYGSGVEDLRHHFTFSPNYLIPGKKFPGQMLEGWSVSGILNLQSGLPWTPSDSTSDDLLGTGEFNNSSPMQSWNYSGSPSAFKAGPTPIPCFGTLPGCSSTVLPQDCITAAQAPYAANAQLQQLALASVTNFGCYMQNGGILTPPAYGTLGNAYRNIFRGPNYYNVDFSVGKIWRFKERFSAQFRLDFFNVLNRGDFLQVPATTDPSKGLKGNFGCSCTTPDSSALNPNPVLGSGGPRHVQFGLKLAF